MFSNGLSIIEIDELYFYEEGININSVMFYFNWGDLLMLECLMEMVKVFDECIILCNLQGYLLFFSNWFGGNKVYCELNWQWQKLYFFLVLYLVFLLGQYNVDFIGCVLVIGLVDGYLVYVGKDDKGGFILFNEINWVSGVIRGGELNNGFGSGDMMYIFWVVWCWSGDVKYLQVLDYCVVCGGLGVLVNLGENVVDVLGW